MVAGAFAGQRIALGVRETAHEEHPLTKGGERLQRRRQLEQLAVAFGRPAAHEDAVRHIDDAEALDRPGGGRAEGGECRDHAVQQRQGERDPEAAKKGAPRQMLLRDDHDCSRSPHLEWRASDDAGDQRRPPVVARRGLAGDRSHRRSVVVLDAAAERVGQELLGHGLDELVAVAQQDVAEAGGTFEPGAIRQDAGDVDRF